MSQTAEAERPDTPETQTPVRVLLVEDDPVLCETLQYNLQRERLQVFATDNAEDALRLFHEHQPHLVILDVMLPGRSGFDLCRIIRQHSQTPVLFLTARATEEDKIRGFELGADDYIVKPFSVAELIARVRSILRRAQPPTPPRIRFGAIEIDLDAKRVYRNGEEIPMTPKEYALLLLLATHPGKVFSRDQILDHVWGLGTYVNPRTVDVHIRWLRAKIEPDPQNPRYIQTVRGSGYRFEG
mgnify:FL=1